jgi:hypothetical protein
MTKSTFLTRQFLSMHTRLHNRHEKRWREHLTTPVTHPLSSPPGGPASLQKHGFRAAVNHEEEEREGKKRVGFYVAC